MILWLFASLAVFQCVEPFSNTTVIRFILDQYEKVSTETILGDQYPNKGYLWQPQWQTCSVKSEWTVGFFPGILWQLYEITGNKTWMERAIKATDGLYEQRLNTDSHDVGFKIMSSYGEGWRLTRNRSYVPVIVRAADSLALRFDETINCTRSWGSIKDRNNFLVIADNMMNLDLFWQAYEFTGNETYARMALSHADRTSREHLRSDYSSWHVVDFDPKTGMVKRKFTKQGYSDKSCWSRGQAWLILGFIQMCNRSRHKRFCDIAERLSQYFILHLDTNDPVAPWDFSVPKTIGYIPRDVSATVVAAIGFFQIGHQTGKSTYTSMAKSMAKSLLSDRYFLLARNVSLPAIVGNCTISGPNADVKLSDLALVYADYYFLKMLHLFLR